MNVWKTKTARAVVAAIGAVFAMLPLASPAQMPPDPPRVVVAQDGEEQLTIFWEAPQSNGGAEITTYTLRWKPAGATYAPDAVVEIATSDDINTGVTDGEYVITGLRSGQLYEVQVAAVNAAGMGAYSPPIFAAPTLGAPQNLRATTGAGEIHMEWEAPLLGDPARITGYAVYWEVVPDYMNDLVKKKALKLITGLIGARPSDRGSAATGATTYTVTGLRGGVTYEVKAAARTETVQGKYASTTAAVNSPGALPGAPRDIRITAADGALHVAWQAPAMSMAEYSYHLRWGRYGRRQLLYKGPNSAATPAVYTPVTARGEAAIRGRAHTITRLRNDSAYQVEIAAVEDGRIGEYAKGPDRYPLGTPQNVQVSAGTYTLTLQWDAPAAAEAVRSYHLRWREDAAAAPRSMAQVNAAATAYAITGLDSGTTYFVQVASANSGGAADYSPEKKAVTLGVAFKLDVNDDGVENAHDGILISRYLLGVRGDALTHGQTNAPAEDIEKIIKAGVTSGKLQVITTGAEAQWQDGIEVAKFLLGVAPASEEVAEKIRKLMAQ
ncbi:MAG: fibronectin type III domain-containing protein [Gammaproteobacteria bacterium]